MLRMWRRVGATLGLTVLVLMLAGSVLGVSEGRSEAAQPIGAENQPQAAAAAPNFTIVMSTVVGSGGLNQPTDITNAGDGSGRLFVLEQAGYIRVLRNGALLSTPYLDLTSKVTSGGEQGLLGLAFDPDFATNGIFYVNYTSSDPTQLGNTIVARYQVANASADVANVIKVTPIITIDQPQANHNGGDVVFGPDGYLYIGMGDGGNANDEGPGHAPEGNGQAHGTLLGKILRLNVRGVPTYTIPPTNPFTQTAGYKPEIWALGLRNPWRFSFDRTTGDLYIGDVGQNCWEEIDYQPASSHGGENYGWRLEEGSRQFDPNDAFNCNMPASTLLTTTKPITAYNHDFGSAVTGGYVYRGLQYPWLDGVYFYSDSGSGRIWAAQQTSPGHWSTSEMLDTAYGVTSFGEDENGELYVTDYNQGRIFKITSPATIDFSSSSKRASPNQVSTGSTVAYTIVLRNTGTPFNDTVRMTDTVPTGLSYVSGSLAASSGLIDASAAPTLKWNGTMSTAPTSIVTITYRALVTASSIQSITNTATINPALIPPFTRSAIITVTTSSPNLSGSTKQASAASAQWNNVLTYTIVLRNSGQSFTQTVRVTDTLPAGLAYVPGTLTATRGIPDDSAAPSLKWNGDMVSTPVVTITYRAAVTAFLSQTLTNAAAINPGVGVPFNRSAAVVISGPDLTSSTKQASSSIARSDDIVTYTIVVRNTGGSFPATVRVTDTLPADLAYVPGSLRASSGASDDASAPILKWSGTLSTTPAVTVTLVVSVTTSNVAAVVNSATIHPGYGSPFARTATIVVNPHEVFLPLILHN
ncbi:MAG TPA: PQQ-dependent sugar dehydrogenase [Anaerolineae bacterium]|nr:PQQ-dependent sugar dehydrogenase [Anaerolineae bacterium]